MIVVWINTDSSSNAVGGPSSVDYAFSIPVDVSSADGTYVMDDVGWTEPQDLLKDLLEDLDLTAFTDGVLVLDVVGYGARPVASHRDLGCGRADAPVTAGEG